MEVRNTKFEIRNENTKYRNTKYEIQSLKAKFEMRSKMLVPEIR